VIRKLRARPYPVLASSPRDGYGIYGPQTPETTPHNPINGWELGSVHANAGATCDVVDGRHHSSVMTYYLVGLDFRYLLKRSFE
jgi:hypothetical protein